MFTLRNLLLKYESRVPLLLNVRCFKVPEIKVGQTLAEKLAEYNAEDPETSFKVDIGLPPPKPIRRKEIMARAKYIQERKNDPILETQSMKLELDVDYDDIRNEWKKNSGAKDIQIMADHYNIFSDLFGDAYFTPYVLMDIDYPQKDKPLVAPVCRGNVIKPGEAFYQPMVSFKSEPDELWTLVLVNPDGHFTEENMEYVHWFVGNIPGGDVEKGEVIWDYLPPFPPRGLGFQRFIFVLYKQEKKMDYSKLKKQIPCLELKDRTFNTLEFYRERQDDLTPAGLSFFQSDWDKTSRKVYHEILNMDEPVFEYEIEPLKYNEQVWFPKGKPFNLYLDRYRDPQDINKENLVKKLKEVHPFKAPVEPFPYPRALMYQYKGMPSWLITKELRFKLGLGRSTKLRQDEYE